MATTKPQPAKANKPTTAPVTAPSQPKAKRISQMPDLPFLFDRQNYMIMIAGIVVIIIGFVLMTGPANDNPAVFNKEEIYSFRRITLAPIIVMIGFLIEVFAIMKKPSATAAV